MHRRDAEGAEKDSGGNKGGLEVVRKVGVRIVGARGHVPPRKRA